MQKSEVGSRKARATVIVTVNKHRKRGAHERGKKLKRESGIKLVLCCWRLFLWKKLATVFCKSAKANCYKNAQAAAVIQVQTRQLRNSCASAVTVLPIE